MKNNIHFCLLFCLIFISFHSCKIKSKEDQIKDSYIYNLEVENFNSFHKKFKEDFEFQLSRISFPLNGISINNEKVGFGDNNETLNNGTKVWTKKNWERLYSANEIDTAIYAIKIQELDSLVVYSITGKQFGFLFEETYKAVNGKWYLIKIIDKNM